MPKQKVEVRASEVIDFLKHSKLNSEEQKRFEAIMDTSQFSFNRDEMIKVDKDWQSQGNSDTLNILATRLTRETVHQEVHPPSITDQRRHNPY